MLRVLLGAVLVASSLGLPLPAAAATADEAAVARVYDLTNAEREKAGLPRLALSAELGSSAQLYSEVLASSPCFEHTCGPVPSVVIRVERAGYMDWSVVGENIAAGYRSPEAVLQGWMTSTAHRENILSARYTEVGIGLTTVSNGTFSWFWAQNFGKRFSSEDPE